MSFPTADARLADALEAPAKALMADNETTAARGAY